MSLTLHVLSDLHYGYREDGDISTKAMAEQLNTMGGDALIITGDLAIRNPLKLAECLTLFDGFKGPKMFVAGNHDLWSPPFTAMERYETKLDEIGSACGFHYLDNGPLMIGTTAFVGTIGWYDYEFRDPDLEVDFKYYEKTSWPGVASWNDRHWISWDFDNPGFTAHCAAKLQAQIEEVRDQAETIVACMHHIPFTDLVKRQPDNPAWSFSNAFMGSPRFGEILLAEPKAKLLLCGHSHRRIEAQIGHVRAISSGCHYDAKRLETVTVGDQA
jgi:3',5'-cyclic AMP phosphodiesterase CpdA